MRPRTALLHCFAALALAASCDPEAYLDDPREDSGLHVDDAGTNLSDSDPLDSGLPSADASPQLDSAGSVDRGPLDAEFEDGASAQPDSATSPMDAGGGYDLSIPAWMYEEMAQDDTTHAQVAVTMFGLSPELASGFDPGVDGYSKGGDAFLIEDEKTMLIDVGFSWAAEDVLIPALRAKGVRRIDHLLISHPHGDHYGGIWKVLAAFDVGMVWANRSGISNQAYADLLTSLGDRYQRPSTGQVIDLGLSTMKVVLSPTASFSANVNDASIITKLVVGQNSMLFTGDCGPAEGNHLAAHHADELRCDVLKFPHHAQIPHAGSNMLNASDPSMVLVPIWEPFWRWGIDRPEPQYNWYSAVADSFMQGREPIFHEAELLFTQDDIRFGRFTQITSVYGLLHR